MSIAPLPRHRARLAVLAPLLLVACPKPEPPDLDGATAADTETPGTLEPEPGATVSPTTGAPSTDTGDEPTTGVTTGSTGHDLSTSSGDDTGGTTDPNFGQCPPDAPGVLVGLARSEQDVVTDLDVRPCGTSEQFPALAVIAAGDDHLEAAVCADPQCGACDPADTLTLSLTVPGPFAGLPEQLGAGDCIDLAAAWAHTSEAPGECTISSLVLVRSHDGQPDPLPTFLYRYTETLPAGDSAGPFSLTADLAGPGPLTCPCDGDCCLDTPGTRRLRFTAKLDKAEIEVPSVDPGAVVPAFAFGTPEGDDLLGSLALVRSHVPATCGEPARHEWLLRVTPG